MKSVKLYFSLLLSAMMLAVAVPAMAVEAGQNDVDTSYVDEEAQDGASESEEGVEESTADSEANGPVYSGSEGRPNELIDDNFSVGQAVEDFAEQSGLSGFADDWRYAVMLLVSFVLLYLAIVKKFEPLLLMPIAFGMLLTNLPGAGMFHSELFAGGHVHWADFAAGSGAGLLDYLYLGVKLGIYPCLIFIGVGAMTDFGPLLANPKSLLLGAAAQIGIFATFIGALALGFNYWESGSIGIIGGADGPTSVFVTTRTLYSGLPAEAIYAMLLVMGLIGFIALSKMKQK